MHLKAIQQMVVKVPRSVGIPPLNDASIQEALVLHSQQHQQQQQLHQQQRRHQSNGAGPSYTQSLQPMDGEDDNKVNPLAAMGMSDVEYASMLQDLLGLNGNTFMEGGDGGGIDMSMATNSLGLKRGLEDSESEREGKRSRFEVLE